MAVVATGAGVKMYRQWSHAGESGSAARLELVAQLAAVDSARQADGRGRQASGRRGGRSAGTARPPRQLRAPDASGAPTSALGARSPVEVPTLERVDLDRADSAALERLPRIGPALASRIVADRRLHGDFGSLVALQRVRGIGPKLAQLLQAHVTFSGTPRPSPVPR